MQSLLLEASPPLHASPLPDDESPLQSPLASLSSSVDWVLAHASAAPEHPSAVAAPTSELEVLAFDDCWGCEVPVGPGGGTKVAGAVNDGRGVSPQLDP